jgi:glycosyltransferase involved in cell wall biosynthesis
MCNAPPRLVQSNFRRFNIVSFRGLFYGLHQTLGPVDLASLPADVNTVFPKDQFLQHATLRGLRRLIRQLPTPIDQKLYWSFRELFGWSSRILGITYHQLHQLVPRLRIWTLIRAAPLLTLLFRWWNQLQKAAPRHIFNGSYREIFYPINLLSDHFKITADHPLFHDWREAPPGEWTFSVRPQKLRSPLGAQTSFEANFLHACAAAGANRSTLAQFLKTRSIRASFRGSLLMLPTYPQYFGPSDWFIEIEDWATLFSPFLLNGKTEQVDVFREQIYPIIQTFLSLPNCRGIFTHMQSTMRSLQFLFPNLNRRKLFYVPPAYDSPRPISPRSSSVPQFTFFNSFAAGHLNFVLRGGREVLSAFDSLDRQRIDFRLVIRAQINLDALPLNHQRLLHSPKVVWIQDPIPKSAMDQYLAESYAFLLPAYRIHVISTLQALNFGIPLIVSDGWGFNEFVEHEKNGLVIEGFRRKAYEDEYGLLRENYFADPRESEAIALGIEHAVQRLLQNPSERDRMSCAAASVATNDFSREKRNTFLANYLKSII